MEDYEKHMVPNNESSIKDLICDLFTIHVTESQVEKIYKLIPIELKLSLAYSVETLEDNQDNEDFHDKEYIRDIATEFHDEIKKLNLTKQIETFIDNK